MANSNGRVVGRPESRGDSETLDIFAAQPEPATTTIHRGKARRDRILDETARRKKEAIEWLRSMIIALYRDRRHTAVTTSRTASIPKTFVTADDARDIYFASKFPATYSADFKFAAAIFRDSRFRQTGDRVVSRHPENNGRKIDCWEVVDE